MQVRTKAAAFSTDSPKGTPFTASAAMMEAKISPVPCQEWPAEWVRLTSVVSPSVRSEMKLI